MSDIAEIKQRLGDRWWRISHLYTIKDAHGLEIPFIPNDSQKKLYDELWYLNIILKDRQRGFSTFVAIFILDYCLFNSNSSAGIVDITLPDAKKKLEKIKFAYDRLPDWIKDNRRLVTDNKDELTWSNGSSVYVGTSHRGGTLQVLHISEMGKISARFPDRAREIRTGAMNTLAPGCFIFNESTAEGQGGEFYDDVQTARRLQDSGSKLSQLDYKFHFFGWWQGDRNEIDHDGIIIPTESKRYFDKIENECRIKLCPRKRAWYVKKAAQQKHDMMREYPSTPDEAFQQAVEGAYFQDEMTRMRAERRITRVPYEPGYPVCTAWDLGMNDTMAIWFIQRVGRETRLIDYEHGSGAGFEHYAHILAGKRYVYGRHFMPHDISVRELGTGIRRLDAAESLGIRPIYTVPRAKNSSDLLTDIDVTRQLLATCVIDEERCVEGIKALDNFRRDWDDKNATYRSTPCHNWAIHGADALRTGAVGLKQFGADVSAWHNTVHVHESMLVPEVV